VDVFNYVGPQGQSLRHALDWVIPYALANTTLHWPHQEETPFDHGKFFQLLRVAAIKYNNASYEAMIPRLSGDVNYTHNTINLVWPRPAVAGTGMRN
jgi:hypothetical protein